MSASSVVFAAMSEAVEGASGKALQRKFKGTVVFHISDTNETFALDLKDSNGNFSVKKGESAIPQPDLHITVNSSNMNKLIDGKLKPQQAFMKGLLKIKGNMGLAMKLNAVLVATRKKLPRSKL